MVGMSQEATLCVMDDGKVLLKRSYQSSVLATLSPSLAVYQILIQASDIDIDIDKACTEPLFVWQRRHLFGEATSLMLPHACMGVTSFHLEKLSRHCDCDDQILLVTRVVKVQRGLITRWRL